MKIDYDYLRERLWKCPHAYEDFVEGTIVKIKQEATEQDYNELVQILENNPDISYSEIVKLTQYSKREVIITDE